MNVEGWMMKDDDFKLLKGFALWWTNEQTDISLNNVAMLEKQAEKLKSRKMKEGWMKNDECWRMNDEGWRFQVVEGFCD